MDCMHAPAGLRGSAACVCVGGGGGGRRTWWREGRGQFRFCFETRVRSSAESLCSLGTDRAVAMTLRLTMPCTQRIWEHTVVRRRSLPSAVQEAAPSKVTHGLSRSAFGQDASHGEAWAMSSCHLESCARLLTRPRSFENVPYDRHSPRGCDAAKASLLSKHANGKGCLEGSPCGWEPNVLSSDCAPGCSVLQTYCRCVQRKQVWPSSLSAGLIITVQVCSSVWMCVCGERAQERERERDRDRDRDTCRERERERERER